MTTRRNLLCGAAAATLAVASPAIVRAQSILVPLAYKPTTYTSAAIQVAINQAAAGGGGLVRLPAGVFNITSSMIGADNVTVIGSGGRATELRYANALDGLHVFNGFGCNGFRVHDCFINAGDYLGPTDGGSLIRFGYDRNLQKGGAACEFRRNIVVGLRRYGLFADGDTRHLIVDDNYLEANASMNGSDTGGISNVGICVRPHAVDASAPGGLRSLLHVTGKINRNTTANLCGIAFAGWKFDVTGNNCRGSGFGANIVAEDDVNCADCRITDNEGSGGALIRADVATEGFEIWGHGHLVANNLGVANASDGLPICGYDIRAIANTMVNNGGAGFVGHPQQPHPERPNTFLANSSFGNAGGATRFPVPVILGANDFR